MLAERNRRHVVAGLTIVFGIVPATVLLVFAGTMAWVGMEAVVDFAGFTSVAIGLMWIVVGLMAVAGYVGLYFAALSRINRRIVGSLCAGILANGYGSYLVTTDPPSVAYVFWYSSWLPFIVGCAHIARYLAQVRSERSRWAGHASV